MRHTPRTSRLVTVAAVAAIAVTVPSVAFAGNGSSGSGSSSGGYSSGGGAVRAVALLGDGTKVARFNTFLPSLAARASTISGLAGDTKLVGIDYRVQDGNLYGVGDAGGVYTVDAASGAAVKASQLSVALSGTSFGVDFNPAANRLRVVSDTGQNLRHNIDDGATAGTTLVDGTLTYPPAPATATGVTAAAYTNNDLDTDTATTLFDIDTTLDQVVTQVPANAGSLAPTGKLTVDAGSDAGFDIYSDVGRDGKTENVKGFAVLQVGGKSNLYVVNLLTGEASKAGTFRATVTDLAVALDR